MAHFMVAFDRLTRRYAVERNTYDRGTFGKTTVLCSDPLVPGRIHAKDRRGKPRQVETPRFSRATRRYLARRAFRYFRAIGRADRARYGRAMRLALPLYEDRHLDAAVRILDSWALVHVLSITRLRWLAFHAEAPARTHYVYFEVPKRTGGMRLLSAPHDDLKKAQHWILEHVLAKLPVTEAAHGFVPGRSVVSNARAHVLAPCS